MASRRSSDGDSNSGEAYLKARHLIVMEIYKYIGAAEITSVEFEGPEIAVYVKNPKFIIDNEDRLKDLARHLRKRIVVRTDPSSRKTREATIRFIRERSPQDVYISEIVFDEVLGEVKVVVDKPGRLVGKNRVFAKEVLAETGWKLEVIRKPLMKSKILDSIIRHLLKSTIERRKALREIGERIYRETLVGTRYIRLIGLGSFGEVGRSSILVDTGESKVLLDAGVSPSGTGPDVYPFYWAPEFNIDELDAVVISHAHMDHVGALPLLYKHGFRGPVYATPPTRDIMVLVLKDYIDIATREGQLPPFDEKDIKMMMTRIITVPYNVVTDVAPDIKLTFTNAGHILGSSLVHLHIGQGLYNILYTGDFKYYRIKGDKGTRLIPPATYQFHRVEALIMEATYAAKETQPRDKAESDLIELINRVYKRRGKILIPVMAVGRGQEILMVVNKAMKEKLIPEIPVYVEGMVYEVTSIYTHYPELLMKPVRDAMLINGENPFEGPTTIYVGDHSKREEAMYSQDPAIIIATSGMMNGGPVVEYFKYLAEDPRNALVFVSYQAPGTLGRRIQNGEKEIPMEFDGKVKSVRVNLEVATIEGFTGHATKSELQLFLKHLNPKPRTILFNHAEPGALVSMASTVKSRWSKLGFDTAPEVYIPENLEAIRLYPRNVKMHLSLYYS